MHDLKLWDDSCYNPYTPRTSVTPSQVFGFSPSLIRDVSKPMTGCHRDFRLSSGGHLPENKVADERAGEKSKNSEEKEANVGEGEEEGMEEMEEHQAKAIITRRKRRMLSKSASNSAGGSPATIPVQPPLPFIPYSPSVFPQAKRKGAHVAFPAMTTSLMPFIFGPLLRPSQQWHSSAPEELARQPCSISLSSVVCSEVPPSLPGATVATSRFTFFFRSALPTQVWRDRFAGHCNTPLSFGTGGAC